jgi:hypothetical protein
MSRKGGMGGDEKRREEEVRVGMKEGGVRA